MADDWYQSVLDEGIEQGIAQGFHHGFEQGRRQGLMQALTRILQRKLGTQLAEPLCQRLGELPFQRLTELVYGLGEARSDSDSLAALHAALVASAHATGHG